MCLLYMYYILIPHPLATIGGMWYVNVVFPGQIHINTVNHVYITFLKSLKLAQYALSFS